MSVLIVVYPIHKDVTMKKILNRYNKSLLNDGSKTQFKEVICDGKLLYLDDTMDKVAVSWKLTHSGIEKNIITLEFK
jgi:hypothetical protein